MLSFRRAVLDRTAEGGCTYAGGLADLAQTRRRGLCGDISLRRSQHFEPDHKFPNRRGAQQRRIKVRVQMPFRMLLAIGGALVKTHGVGKWSIEDAIIATGQL